jgi:hypothetical protein
MAANTKGDTFENDLLKLIFNNTAITTIGDAGGLLPSASAGSLFVSLHTSDPGETGTQTTNEISYTGYARVAVARSAGGWTITANSVSPTAAITFGQMTAGAGGTVTHAGIGAATSGTGKLMYMGTVTPNIAVANGVTPSLTTASTVVED